MVKIKAKDPKEFVSRIDEILSTIQRAKSFGQTALVEELVDHIFIDVYESALSSSGFLYSITFEELKDFQSKCCRKLNIDYVKNFTRIIPNSVFEKKKFADELEIFDNYVILHYDPKKKSVKETKKEIERRRDPILFGIIQGSKKLYYIADWVDEFCDLTLDQFLDVTKKSINDIKTIKK